MTSTENTNFEEKFSEQPLNEHTLEDHATSNGEDSGLTLRALVSTKEAGVIIGKGIKKTYEYDISTRD
jgi:hypothetical protein